MRRRRSRRPGILTPVLDRPRVITLSWAAVCLALFGVLALGGDRATGRRSTGSTTSGGQAEDWADDHDALQQVLRVRSRSAFNTIPVMVCTTVIAGLLLVREVTGGRRSTPSR